MRPESTSTAGGFAAASAHSITWAKHQLFACALTVASMLGLAPFATPPVQAQTFTVLHAFTGEDGELPWAGLVVDAKGNLYGTTYFGGAFSEGVVFKVDKTRKETVLHSFNFATDGGDPEGSLVMDAKGNLYGTTLVGGASGTGGTVFKVSAEGKETVLYSFCSKMDCADGATPWADLVMDAKGNLYGTTESGGDLNCNCGLVFKLAGKKETVLYSFRGSLDGANPYAGLVMDAKGNLYGTTLYGGGTRCPAGYSYSCGTMFKVSKSGEETVLHRFAFGADGWGSYAGLIIDAKGSLYGTTANGGTGNGGWGYGTVFKVSPTGKETVLYRFTGGTDGGGPVAGLIMDTKGNLYGTTQTGGAGCGDWGCGVVFKLAP